MIRTEATNRPTSRIDMSPEAVDQRLRDLGQLYQVGMSLRDLQPIAQAAERRPDEEKQRSGPAQGP